MGVGKGDASAVIDVVMPQTTGCSLAGNTAVMLSRRVGSRIARCPPRPPLVGADGVHVADPRRLPRVQREPAVRVLEEKPDFLEGVPVVLDVPRHGLIAARRGQPDLFPGQRVLAVEPIRPLRVTRVPVHRDPDQVLGHRLRAGVAQLPPDTGLVHAVPVGQLSDFVLHDQVGPGSRLRVVGRRLVMPRSASGQLNQGLVHVPPAPHERPPGTQMLVSRFRETPAR